MLKQSKIAFLVGALVAGAAFANTTSTVLVVDQPIAREAGEARGEGKGHPAIELKDQLAREAGEGARGRGGEGEGAGHPAIELKDQLAKGPGRGKPEDDGIDAPDGFDDNGVDA